MQSALTERKQRRAGVEAVLLIGALFLFPVAAQPTCVGDCDGDGFVAIEEVVTLVRVLLGESSLGLCVGADANEDGTVDVAEIVKAVRSLLAGCPTRCGNGLIEEGEQCDDGGICLGTANAGSSCQSDQDCFTSIDQWRGVCRGGERPYTACNDDSDCPLGRCVACWTFGGDGCAANCTREHTVPFELQVAEGGNSSSGSYLPILPIGDLFEPQPIGVRGSLDLTLGEQQQGRHTVAVRAASGRFPQVAVFTLACACMRLAEYKTCGGAIFAPDGTYVELCTEGFAPQPAACPTNRPCASVFGPGNAGAGVIGCGGLAPANVCLRETSPGGSIETRLSGEGGPGTFLLYLSLAMGAQAGRCSEEFCTDADPPELRGTPLTGFFTTARACARFADETPGMEEGCVRGAPISCDHWAVASLTGLRICTGHLAPPSVRGASCLEPQ